MRCPTLLGMGIFAGWVQTLPVTRHPCSSVGPCTCLWPPASPPYSPQTNVLCPTRSTKSSQMFALPTWLPAQAQWIAPSMQRPAGTSGEASPCSHSSHLVNFTAHGSMGRTAPFRLVTRCWWFPHLTWAFPRQHPSPLRGQKVTSVTG